MNTHVISGNSNNNSFIESLTVPSRVKWLLNDLLMNPNQDGTIDLTCWYVHTLTYISPYNDPCFILLYLLSIWIKHRSLHFQLEVIILIENNNQ